MPLEQIGESVGVVSAGAPVAVSGFGRFPSFGDLVGELFHQGSAEFRAAVLNRVLEAMRPSLVSEVLGQDYLPGLQVLLGNGRTEVTPEEADRVATEELEQMAEQGAALDPHLVERFNELLAENSRLFYEQFGGTPINTALSGIANRLCG